MRCPTSPTSSSATARTGRASSARPARSVSPAASCSRATFPKSEKAEHYRLADVFVMASHGEGFGFVLLEALACGVPVIASRLDGGREARPRRAARHPGEPRRPQRAEARDPRRAAAAQGHRAGGARALLVSQFRSARACAARAGAGAVAAIVRAGHEAGADRRHFRPGRRVPRAAPARQGLRGLRRLARCAGAFVRQSRPARRSRSRDARFGQPQRFPQRAPDARQDPARTRCTTSPGRARWRCRFSSRSKRWRASPSGR